MLEFKVPFLLFLIPLIVGAVVFIRFRQERPAYVFPSLSLVKGLQRTWRVQFQFVPFLLRCLVLTLFLIALAGPRVPLEAGKVVTEGVNIVLVLDSSTSMAAEDFTINGRRENRLSVVKNVVRDFVDRRVNDRLGLIAFAARPYLVCPLTTDYSWFKENLARIDFGLMEDGTAIGSAIASGANRLRNVEGKSKVMILLTDGVNNAGKIDPLDAAKAAQSYGIKIYTIGAGTKDFAPYPITDLFGRKGYQNVKIEIDEEVLKKIADTTGGRYYRATDTASLENVYKEIDRLEKVKIEESGYQEYHELFGTFVILGLLLLLLEVVLERTVFLRIP